MLKTGQHFSFIAPKLAVLGKYSGFFYLPAERFNPRYVEGLSDHHKVKISPDDVLIVIKTEPSNDGWTVRFRMKENSRLFILYQHRDEAEEGEDAAVNKEHFIEDSDIVLVGKCMELVS